MKGGYRGNTERFPCLQPQRCGRSVAGIQHVSLRHRDWETVSFAYRKFDRAEWRFGQDCVHSSRAQGLR